MRCPLKSGHGMHRILLPVAVQMACASFHFVEFNDPAGGLPPEGMHGKQAPLNQIALDETIFIAMYAGNRWVSRGVDASDPSNIKLLRGAPSWPAIARAAMLAFETGAVLKPPERRAPYNFFCWAVDTCFNDVECEHVHTLKLMSKLLLGDGANYGPASSIIGGTWWMLPIGQLASAWAVPDIGFWSEGPELSNKEEYPFYLRANANGAILWEGTAAVLRYLNFTKVMVWHSSDAEALTAKEIFMKNQAAWNLEVQSALCPDGEHTALPPEAAITVEADPEREGKYKALARQAKQFNAHANINAMSAICPVYDLMHYMSMNGLFGKGQFWAGSAITLAIYHQDYLYAIQFGRVMQGLYDYCPPDGSVNCWIMQTPLDGYLSLQPQDQGEMYPVFWEWWKSLRFTYPEVFEPWIAAQVEDVAFQDPVDGIYNSWWRLPVANFVFDSVWATLLSINSLLLRRGRNFTGHELLQEMKNTSFEGITGHVSFDEVGDRKMKFMVKQYQRPCSQDQASSRRIQGGGNSSGNSSNSSNGTQIPSNCNAELGAFLSDTTNNKYFAAYGDCLKLRCEDMNPLIVSALSQGRFDNCESLYYGICQKCDFDLGSMSDVDTLPLGLIYMRDICAVQCPRGPVAVGEPPYDLPGNLPACPGYPLPPQPITCFGYPEAGKEVLLGTYTGALTLTGTPFQFHSCAPKAPDRDLACSKGQFYHRIEAICVKCSRGRFTMRVGQSACLACQAGSYSAVEAASTCEACGLDATPPPPRPQLAWRAPSVASRTTSSRAAAETAPLAGIRWQKPPSSASTAS